MATAITKAPRHKVRSHTAPNRDGYTLSSTWKVPTEATRDSSYRATKTFISWDLFYRQGSKTVKLVRAARVGNVTTTSSSASINSFVPTGSSGRGQTFTRESFWPYTTRKLVRVDHNVRLENHKLGPVSTSSTKLVAPSAPSIGSWAFDTDTGTVSVKITAAKTTSRAERKITKYTWKVQKGKYVERTQKFKCTDMMVSVTNDFTGGEKKLSYDCVGYQALKDGELYLCTLSAKSRGLAGDSKTITKKYVVAPPATVTIKTPTITIGEGGRVTVPVRTNRKAVYVKSGNTSKRDYYVNQIDGVVLQAAIDVTAKTASSVSGTAWEDIGSVDDGDCTYLATDTASLTPSQNNYSYVRVKSWRFDDECEPLCRYSNIKALNQLRTTETASNDESAILELTSMADGEGAYMLIGYEKTSGGGAADDADGTEVSWADASTAWNSTEKPEKFEVAWSTATSGADEDDYYYDYVGIWNYVQRVYIRNLDEGTQYWFRTRRYNDDENGVRTYGSYCNKIWGTSTDKSSVRTNATLIPTVKPTQVTLAAPASVPTGSDVTLTWTYDGGDQTAFRVYLGGGTRIVASKKTASSSYLLKHETYEQYVSSDNTLSIMVSVSTSKRRDTFTESSWSTVTFAEAPVLEASVSTVTAQPATITLYSTTPASSVSTTISALGSDGDDAIGIEPQVLGDDVWSSVSMPTWTETTWGSTTWYASNVTTAVTAANNALEALPLVTDTFTGGTDATIVSVDVADEDDESGEEELRTYIVAQPSSSIGAYMLATLVIDTTSWELSSSPVWCDSTGVESSSGAYLRFPWPLTLEDDTSSFSGSTVALEYMPEGDEYDENWNEYTELSSTADALASTHDADETVYETTVTMPSNIDFRDNASYTLNAVVTAAESGLASNVAEAEFVVQWAHQAPSPDDGITVTPFDTTDSDGLRTIGATIQLSEPSDAASTDVADVWRVSSDGAHLIAEDRELTDAVVDNYAPFGDAELAYRVVMRTVDGDVDWADYGYDMDLKHTRIDFGDSYVELPYNVQLSNSYSKTSEQRVHLGERLARGFWGSSHGRTFSISSDLIKSSSREQRELLHELGNYMGPVFVRTQDGCCMEAEVTPDMSIVYNSPSVPVTIRGTEIELTSEHMAVPDDDPVEEGS